MKKMIAMMLALVLCASCLSGCFKIQIVPTNTEPATEPTTEATEPTTEATEPTTEATEPTTEATEPVTEATEPTTEATEPATQGSTGAEGFSGPYANLDKMQFAINGKIYTLGETTLQMLIDDGVPFKEEDLANANNNLNKNTASQDFGIVLGEYWTAYVSVLNDTDGNKPIAECYVHHLYVPVDQDKTQDILTLAFPLNLTIDELKANSGEPTEYDRFDGTDGFYIDTLEYSRESTKYLRSSEYCFEYHNDSLRYVTITYYP